MTIEKRKKRTVTLTDGKKVTTVRTYRNFRKFLKQKKISYVYSRKKKVYSETLREVPTVQKKIIPKKKKKVFLEAPPIKRIRKQVVLNYRSSEEPYAVSIRAITINPEINERGLLIAVQETMSEIGINLENFSKRYLGFEEALIPNSEDRRLNDLRVYIEIFVRKEKPVVYVK